MEKYLFVDGSFHYFPFSDWRFRWDFLDAGRQVRQRHQDEIDTGLLVLGFTNWRPPWKISNGTCSMSVFSLEEVLFSCFPAISYVYLGVCSRSYFRILGLNEVLGRLKTGWSGDVDFNGAFSFSMLEIGILVGNPWKSSKFKRVLGFNWIEHSSWIWLQHVPWPEDKLFQSWTLWGLTSSGHPHRNIPRNWWSQSFLVTSPYPKISTKRVARLMWSAALKSCRSSLQPSWQESRLQLLSGAALHLHPVWTYKKWIEVDPPWCVQKNIRIIWSYSQLVGSLVVPLYWQ